MTTAAMVLYFKRDKSRSPKRPPSTVLSLLLLPMVAEIGGYSGPLMGVSFLQMTDKINSAVDLNKRKSRSAKS